jgi:putative tryptophan/tyrosine transport system substrate-binding protein
MRRREFIGGLAGAAAWPAVARAQQSAIPVVGLVVAGSSDSSLLAFRKGLHEIGLVEGRDVTVEYHPLVGQYDQLGALMADLVRRQVAVIATPGNAPATRAAKSASAAIPIVFGVGDDPVKLGLAASLARPGGNATGINFFSAELVAKRLSLLHQMVPTAVHIGVLVNPSNVLTTETTLREVQEAARTIGLRVDTLNASTSLEIDKSFATLPRMGIEALVVAGDGLFTSRRVQLATLAARDRIPAIYSTREIALAGGLMSYGADFVDMFHQVGIYTGKVLKGVKPVDLPVQQSTKFEFVINLQTARLLGIEVPSTLLAIADDVIE